MAKKDKPTTTAGGLPVTDLSLFYSDLAFFPENSKESKLWMSMSLFNAKLNGIQFLDRERAIAYRKLNMMDINKQDYINLIDPPTPMGGGGDAKYFASDFKDIPIAIHLHNIRDAKLDKIPIENDLQVNEIDKFAKSQRQKDKDKVIYQRAFRKLINEVNKEIGLPPISESETPYEYVEKMRGDDPTKNIDDISRLIQQIQSQVKDEKDFALYERYVYKGDIERAFELGIKHYLINQNKWRLRADFFNWDIVNFNRACGRWYIDETTGRGNVEYIDPVSLFTSPFYQKDGDDIIYFYYEKDITFAEWLRQFGQTLTNEQIKEVLLLNKTNAGVGVGNVDGWQSWGFHQRNNCMIRIGYFSVLTQEMNQFSEEYASNRSPLWEKRPLTWKPDDESSVVKQKAYNVWYSCYYIPTPGSKIASNTMADWAWQSQYIFNIQKDVDMYRYGVDQRYAKPTLVIYKNERPSCTDIEESYMPKIRTMWHKFQNCLVQDTNAVVIDWDFMMGILNATDEANKNQLGSLEKPTGGNGINAGLEQFRMMRQGGIAFMKFRDKNGNYPPGFDPSKFFVNVDTKHLDKAEKYLALILQQYELLKVALAQSDITEGQAPKPRTPVEGIKATLASAKEGLWTVEKAVREFLIMYGERVVQMILNMVKEKDKYGYTDRWDEFADVCGLAQALMVEGIADLEPQNIGISVSLEDTTAMNEYIFALANEMAKNKEVSWQGAGLVIDTLKNGSYKYAYALLMLARNEQERINQQQEELAHQRQMELGKQQLEIAQSIQAAKDAGKAQGIQVQGEVDAKLTEILTTLKTQSQAALMEQRKNSKLEENAQKSDLKKSEKQTESDLEQQKAFQV